MSNKKVLVVFGATGIQGGSVIKSILESELAEEFTLRAVSRDLSKPKSQALIIQGVEVVTADLNDPQSIFSVLEGAYAVFLVTDFWATFSKEAEILQGKTLADAAKECNIQHLIFSSLPSALDLSKGALTTVYHFDSKAIVESYIRSLDIPATFIMTGFYMNNLPGQRFAFSSSTNTWTLTLPMPANTQIPLYAAEFDTGKFVKSILSNRNELLGKTVYGTSGYITPLEMVQEFKEVFPEAGKAATFVQSTVEEFGGMLTQYGLPDVAREDLCQMMQLFATFGYYGGASLDPEIVKQEDLTGWKEYAANADAFKGLV